MPNPDSKILYLTAGAGGMFCGSCMHDNALSRALSDHGWNIQLVPTYTPIRTDEANFSVDQVLFGGINVYLQQKIPLLKYVPAFLDRFLDSPWLIRKVTSNAMETDAKLLGNLAFSMLKGSKGNQAKEVAKLCKWLKLSKPELIIFSNVLIGGCIEDIKREFDVPILVTLQGDDVFLDSLIEPFHNNCINRIKELVPLVDGFVVQSKFFKRYMSEYFGIPLEKIHVTPLGLETKDFESFLNFQRQPTEVRTIGYMARLAVEKGLHHLVDAFIELRSRPDTGHFRLKIAGWLSKENEAYVSKQWEKLEAAGLANDYEYLGAIDREEKLDLFKSIDVLTVPTEFLEPKGLYALEALASGVPVVLPDHGSFPELVKPSGGGLLYPPGNLSKLVDCWIDILGDDQRRIELGENGKRYVHEHRNATTMAKATSTVIEQFLKSN
jgi:glycosyltransferase involved in cell wall biosynthesis